MKLHLLHIRNNIEQMLIHVANTHLVGHTYNVLKDKAENSVHVWRLIIKTQYK